LDPSVGKELKLLMSNAMDRRIDWIRNMMNKGLEIFVAIEEPKNEIINYKWAGKIRHSDLAINGKVPMGLLECVPIEHALEPITGKNSLFINCMWILPPFWGKNVAKALINAFIERACEVGSASVLAYDEESWFETTIEYMPMNFFINSGFIEVDRDMKRVLLFLDFNNNSPPKFLPYKMNTNLSSQQGRLNIFCNDQCPWSTYMVKEVQEGIKQFEIVDAKLISTNNRDVIEKWGISRGITLNNKPIAKRMVTWNQIKKEFDCLESI
jgi:GNAT superfamily N-acetyltransferase